MNENELITSKEMRSSYIERIEVLDKVKGLVLLPNDFGATTEMVANYFEVEEDTVKKCIQRNSEELQENGLRVLDGEQLKSFKDKIGYSSRARKLALFSKRTILNVALLLRDSKVADNIKLELGLPTGSNLRYRKEKVFEDNLKLMLQEIENELFTEEYNDVIIDKNKALKNILKYETQYNVCNSRYRIDFYFPYLNFAVEYDEKYHESDIQKEKDSKREYGIMRDIYIHKYYKENELEEYNKLLDDEFEPFSSVEEIFDEEYNEGYLEYSFDIVRFFRIKEDDENIGLIRLCSAITNKSIKILNSCGMSCNYSEFI